MDNVLEKQGPGSKLKLHLGCGEVYLEGYVNIDYPPSEHTVQQISVADEFADLTKLRYKKETIEEVRLHHVFEHFPRAQAIALLASWHSWLQIGGGLQIEVPDFDATSKIVLAKQAKGYDRKVAIRHIFGSNEAPWAVHYDGWSKGRLTELFEVFGFMVEEIHQTAYLATRNIIAIGHKSKRTPSRLQLIKIARAYLAQFNLDKSKTETRLHEIWMDSFTKQLDDTYAK